MNRAKLSPRRRLQTGLVVLLAALATVSVGAFAQQSDGNKNSQQHAPGANYWHRVRPPNLNLPTIPGIGPGNGRADFGGCDAADVTLDAAACGGNPPLPPPPPVCNDPLSSGYGGPSPCPGCLEGFEYDGEKCKPICPDPDAMNFGEIGPCQYCPPGEEFNGAVCVPIAPPTCPPDHFWTGTQCVPVGDSCADYCIEAPGGGFYCGDEKDPAWMNRHPPREVAIPCPGDENIEYDHCGLPIPNWFTRNGCQPVYNGYLCPTGMEYACP